MDRQAELNLLFSRVVQEESVMNPVIRRQTLGDVLRRTALRVPEITFAASGAADLGGRGREPRDRRPLRANEQRAE